MNTRLDCMRNFVRKHFYWVWFGVFLLLGEALFAGTTLLLDYTIVGWFAMSMFAILFTTASVAVASINGIVTNSIYLSNQHFSKHFATKYGDGFELYDSLQKNLQTLHTLQQSATLSDYKKLLKTKDNYNNLLLSVNKLDNKNIKAFYRYCKLHQTFAIYDYTNPQLEEQLAKQKQNKQSAKQVQTLLSAQKQNHAKSHKAKTKQPSTKQKNVAMLANKLTKEKEL